MARNAPLPENVVQLPSDDVSEEMSEKVIAKRLGAEVIKSEEASMYSSEELLAIESWDDLGPLVDSRGGLEFADRVIGNGFTVLSKDEKATLVGRPLVLLEWRFNSGDLGEFVSMTAIQKTGDLPTDIRKVIINDGSTGICKQLRDLTDATGKKGGLIVRRGLKASTYDFEDPKTHVLRPATTYYLDTSAG